MDAYSTTVRMYCVPDVRMRDEVAFMVTIYAGRMGRAVKRLGGLESESEKPESLQRYLVPSE